MTPNGFTTFYFDWLGGIGGWTVFACIALLATAWVLFDSQERHLPAAGWQIASVGTLLLFLPALAVDLEFVNAYQGWPPLFATLGVAAVIVDVALLALYLAAYWGMRGCAYGHGVYDAGAGQSCPVCQAQHSASAVPAPVPQVIRVGKRHPQTSVATTPFGHHQVPRGVWLIDLQSQRRYPLHPGQTRIGRVPGVNDLVLRNDTVSREHALILYNGQQITLYDRASRNGLWLNGRPVNGPQRLANQDVIQLGEVQLRFEVAA